MSYVKLSALIGEDFTVKSVGNGKWVAWDEAASKYVTEPTWFKGASCKYPIESDKGTFDISATHLGSMLESKQSNGKSDIINATYNVKSNGKSGKDIRYYVNLVKTEAKPATVETTDEYAGYEGY